MKREIDNYFFPDWEKLPYWISFDIDRVKKREFGFTWVPEEQGLSIEFMMRFFESFLPDSVGMDFTKVNFLIFNEEQAEIDMQTVRLIIDRVVQTVHHKDSEGLS